MNRLTDGQITRAIQSLGLLRVRHLQQELIEGLRGGNPQGFANLRKLLEQLEPKPMPDSVNCRNTHD